MVLLLVTWGRKLNSRVYAIGDVHGRADLLASLIYFIGDHAKKAEIEPRVFFLGDIVDRGPDSREAMEIVCETLKRWPHSRMLLGNHDNVFLDAMTSQFWVHKWFESLGGLQTLISYLGEGTHYATEEIIGIGRRFPELLGVLAQAPLSLSVGRYLFAHAGINPSVPLADQTRNDLLQVREKFTEYVGPLSHVVVHGHSPQDPPRPVVTENRISLDTEAWVTGVLSMAVIDTDTDYIEFYATSADGQVKAIEPVLLDRGYGTAMDAGDCRKRPPFRRSA